MTFVHPMVLLGLAAVAIPLVLHLLDRRTPPEAEFPSLRYLSDAERQTARRLKLQHLLLLVLRTALIGLVVTAAARPVVPLRGSGAHEPTTLAVILDNSVSSGAVLDGRPVLDRLRAVALGSLAAATAGDRVWLVLGDGVARSGSAAALAATVDSIGVFPQRLDLREAVAVATRVVSGAPTTAREVHVVSDLQQTALGSGRAVVPPGVRVLALAPVATPPANRGIGRARAIDGTVTAPLIGTPDAGPGVVTVRLGGRAVGRAVAAAPSGFTLSLPALRPGWWVGEASLDPDELRADDRRMFVWHVARPAAVSAGVDAGPFVAAAIAVLLDAKRITSGPDVTIGVRPHGGTAIVLPPSDRASLGEVNRALAARGTRWRYGADGTPGPITAPELEQINGVLVSRRQRITAATTPERGSGGDGAVLATVNGAAWLVRDRDVVLVGSRLDTAWTALPRATAFVPFIDALVNRVAPGERPVGAAEGAARVEFELRGADTVGATVYGPDARESDLTPATAALVQQTLGAQVLEEKRFAAARFSGTERAEVSGWVLALAMLVALVELGIATGRL